LLAAPKAAEPPQAPAVGAWVDYRWSLPDQPDSRIRYAVVGGDAEGRRRIEIEILKGGRLARFGYDLLVDGRRTRQIAQLGDQGAVLLMPDLKLSLPETGTMDVSKIPKARAKKWKRIKVPAGTFRCQEVQSVQGVACIDQTLMPMNVVRFDGKLAGRMILMARGFDAKPNILGTPRALPKLSPSAIPELLKQPSPITP
jgi:hypothetical protein